MTQFDDFNNVFFQHRPDLLCVALLAPLAINITNLRIYVDSRMADAGMEC
jgi:hypothetical protein